MTAYRATTFVPPLVRAALDRADAARFAQSCSADVGRLLQVLAASVHRGTIGEIGTGYGVGAAWIASGLLRGTRFLTVEHDPARARAAQAVLAELSNVLVITGEWQTLLAAAPFDLLFVDAAAAKAADQERLLDVLRIGGLVVIDDLTPEDQWPDERRGQADPLRAFWLNDARLAATELLVAPARAVILAARLR